jgi:hypothetical protein
MTPYNDIGGASPYRVKDRLLRWHGAVEQGDEADEAGASDGASQLIPGVRPTRGRSMELRSQCFSRHTADEGQVRPLHADDERPQAEQRKPAQRGGEPARSAGRRSTQGYAGGNTFPAWRTDAGSGSRENYRQAASSQGQTDLSGVRTVRSNKGLKLTRPEHTGASQLNPSVRPTEGTRGAARLVD